MTHDEIRKRHSEHLRSYRQSAEYAAYAKEAGWPVPEEPLPTLLGKRWEIDEETYWEFLEVLPPLAHRGGSFYLSELMFGDITTKYTKEGDKYYCEFARWPLRSYQQEAIDPLRKNPTAEVTITTHEHAGKTRLLKHQVETPWGLAQTITEIAPGIVFYSTPSHGGFWLSDARISSMPKPLRDFVPFGGPQTGPGRWFEEDCYWSVVALAFPQYFPKEAIAAAMKTLEHYKPELYKQVMTAGMGQGRKL